MKENNYEKLKLLEETDIKDGKQRNLQENQEFKIKIKEDELFKMKIMENKKEESKNQEIKTEKDRILSKVSVSQIKIEKLTNDKVSKMLLPALPLKIKSSFDFFFSSFKPFKLRLISFRCTSPGINCFFSSLLFSSPVIKRRIRISLII